MNTTKRIILTPSYMKEFQCIGSACEDTCCVGWNVDLDKDTYRRYKKYTDKEFKLMFDKFVSRKHNEKTEATYGKIKMDNEMRCPFLDGQKLCQIQGKLGEEYLSDTCALYPRYVNKVDGKIERSGTLSCPEIARLALLNPSGIAFEQEEEEISIRIRVNRTLETEGQGSFNKLTKYFWDIRIFSLVLLQNRNYTLDERMIILGIVYQKVETLYQDKHLDEIPNMLQQMEQVIIDGSLKKEIQAIPTDTHIQMRLVKEMMDQKVFQGIASEGYKNCLKQTLIGLGYIEGIELKEVMKNYNQNYEQYVIPYIKEKEYVLENYLVNEFFRELMPLGSYKTVWDAYVFLCAIYSMVKLHMIGMSKFNEGLTDEIMIKLIQSFSKVALHNTKYIQGIIKLLKDNNYDSLAYMTILVKS